jgi:hypothetical protein
MKRTRTQGSGKEAPSSSMATVQVPLPLVSVLADAKTAFFGLCLTAGQQVFQAMMEHDREQACGPKHLPNPHRQAYRGGSAPSEVVLGGRRIVLPRLRARRVTGEELALPSFTYASAREGVANQNHKQRDGRECGPLDPRSPLHTGPLRCTEVHDDSLHRVWDYPTATRCLRVSDIPVVQDSAGERGHDEEYASNSAADRDCVVVPRKCRARSRQRRITTSSSCTSPTISSTVQTCVAIPASIAGVTRRVWWMRAKL